MVGDYIYALCQELFPINRSLSGNGVRQTLNILKRELPTLKMYEVPSGTECFDWTVPKEWNVKRAYIIDPKGNKICDYELNNLHLMGYSSPVHLKLSLEELNKHLYSLPELPNAIPYMTSYYHERWGFCITHNERVALEEGEYEVVIESQLTNGSLTYGELLIEGETKEEIFLSTYICHPSMGNNELSGPTVTTYLAKYIQSLKSKKYSYRIIFIPETIGSIIYLSKNLDSMKRNIVAGFNLTCVGDDNNYSYLASRDENTLADKVAKHILKYSVDSYKTYSFLERGSDERQYCAPGVDLPLCSIMRTKYLEYEEYHTSLDNLDFISAKGLDGAYSIYLKVIDALEYNHKYSVTVLCEPQLGKRGLYPNISSKETRNIVRDMMNFLAYCDGTLDLVDIANKIEVPIWELYEQVDKFKENGLIKSN